MTKDSKGNITATTPEGSNVCRDCGLPYATGTKPAHDAKSSHRSAQINKGKGDEAGGGESAS